MKMELLAIMSVCAAMVVPAQNPIVQTCFTTDPAPMVHDGRLYVYTGHDENNADFFWMQEWRVYSTTDMVNWTDHGSPLALESFDWADDRAWAAQTVERNGKFYWYVCAHSKRSGGMAIGVAIGDSPTGPFKDALGKPLYENGSWDHIDPTVWIDTDGRAFIYWGNPRVYCAELNEDMISFKGEVQILEQTVESFGSPSMRNRVRGEKYKDTYVEGPWFFKRGDNYYLLYAAGGVPEHISYSMSKQPFGPWEYKGEVMPLENTGSFTNHSGVIDYKGHSYFFYHTGKLPGGGGYGRSVAIEEFKYNPDGTFPLIRATDEGVSPVGTLNPYGRVEAETMAFSSGVTTEPSGEGGIYVSDIHNGDYIKVREVDFGNTTPKSFTVEAASALRGGIVEVRLDSINGEKIAEVPVYGTGGWEKMEKFSTDWVKPTTGKHDVYLVFVGRKGPKLFNLDSWSFSQKGSIRNPIINADVPDMSVCRAGDYYYMISTTMHLMPGAPIMRSRDMKTWETVSYVFPSIEDGDRYSLIDNKSAYGQGQWASSIRYHDGKFYVWFTANGEPGRGFVYTAEKGEGPWTLLSRPPHFHDASLLFDDDGRVYLFHNTGELTELNPDLSDVKAGGTKCKLFERDADERGLLEGSSVIKRNGKYYLMMISMDWSIPGRLRREVCYRADNITGPYEKKVILETPFEAYGGVGQGCIVEGAKGEWYALIFQDRGGIGRVPCLMPCKWSEDGWPMLGDAEGHIPNDESLPYASFEGICGSDEFDSPELSLYWQWNHNPINSAWSLTEREGCLRLTTARVVDNIMVAPNTLTQRMTGPTCSGTVCLDVSGMKDGDIAGFAAFNGDSGVLGVEKRGKKLNLVMSEQKSAMDNNKVVTGVEVNEKESVQLKQPRIYLRIDGDFNPGKDIATFYYSLDGENWKTIGTPIKMRFDYRRVFMGSKFAIFNYATKQTGGYVDVESFNYKYV